MEDSLPTSVRIAPSQRGNRDLHQEAIGQRDALIGQDISAPGAAITTHCRQAERLIQVMAMDEQTLD
jgi:hypothetical protein